jgi:hypothetical protein
MQFIVTVAPAACVSLNHLMVLLLAPKRKFFFSKTQQKSKTPKKTQNKNMGPLAASSTGAVPAAPPLQAAATAGSCWLRPGQGAAC